MALQSHQLLHQLAILSSQTSTHDYSVTSTPDSINHINPGVDQSQWPMLLSVTLSSRWANFDSQINQPHRLISWLNRIDPSIVWPHRLSSRSITSTSKMTSQVESMTPNINSINADSWRHIQSTQNDSKYRSFKHTQKQVNGSKKHSNIWVTHSTTWDQHMRHDEWCTRHQQERKKDNQVTLHWLLQLLLQVIHLGSRHAIVDSLIDTIGSSIISRSRHIFFSCNRSLDGPMENHLCLPLLLTIHIVKSFAHPFS